MIQNWHSEMMILFVLFNLFPTVAQETYEFACKDPWRSFGSSCYASFPDLILTYYAAQSHCRSLGSNLVTVNSAEEQEFISSLTSQESWMGLYRIRCLLTSQFYWTDGSQFNYTNWDQHVFMDSNGTLVSYDPEPNEDVCCQRMRTNGLWTDRPCSVIFPFICERPAEWNRTDNIEKRAKRILSGAYLNSPSLVARLETSTCSPLKCMLACLDSDFCSSFNVRQSVQSSPSSSLSSSSTPTKCQCEIFGSESWLSFPEVREDGSGFYLLEGGYSMWGEFKLP